MCVYGLLLPAVLGAPKNAPKIQGLLNAKSNEISPDCCPYAKLSYVTWFSAGKSILLCVKLQELNASLKPNFLSHVAEPAYVPSYPYLSYVCAPVRTILIFKSQLGI